MSNLASVTTYAALDTCNVTTLRSLASEAKIAGRSKMVRTDLIAALATFLNLSVAAPDETSPFDGAETLSDEEIARNRALFAPPSFEIPVFTAEGEPLTPGWQETSATPAQSDANGRTGGGTGLRMALTGKRAHRSHRRSTRKLARAARRNNR